MTMCNTVSKAPQKIICFRKILLSCDNYLLTTSANTVFIKSPIAFIKGIMWFNPFYITIFNHSHLTQNVFKRKIIIYFISNQFILYSLI